MKKRILKAVLLLTTGYFISCGCDNGNCKDPIATIEKSNHLISVSYSDTLYNNFKDRFREPIKSIQSKALEGRQNYDPTRYILINKETLECYLEFLNEIEKKKGNQKITGVAVFLGANKMNESILEKPGFNSIHEKELDQERDRVVNDQSTMNVQSDIRGRITIFMAPTYRLSDSALKKMGMNSEGLSEVQRHVPFYIQPTNKEKDPYKGRYKNLLPIYEPYENIIANTIYQTDSLTGDETSLILEELTDMPPRKPLNLNSGS